MNINNNNVNFTARLNLSEIKTNKQRWNNISHIFENKTKNIDYNVDLKMKDDSLDIFAYNQNENDFEHFCTLSKESTKKLMAMDDEKISGKFEKLIRIFKDLDKTKTFTVEFLNKLEKHDKYGTLTKAKYKDGDSIYDRIFYPVFDKMQDDTIAATYKDPILKDAKIV